MPRFTLDRLERAGVEIGPRQSQDRLDLGDDVAALAEISLIAAPQAHILVASRRIVELPSRLALEQRKTRRSAADDVERLHVVEAALHVLPAQLNDRMLVVIHVADRSGDRVPFGPVDLVAIPSAPARMRIVD